MTNWKIGMKVVCVDPKPEWGLKYGIHTITDVIECKCGSFISVGIIGDVNFASVCNCGISYDHSREYKFKTRCFRLLQYDSNVNMEVIAKFQPLEERSDAPVTKPEKQTA